MKRESTTMSTAHDTHKLTSTELCACQRIYREYQKDTGRGPDAWRRLGQAFAAMSEAVCLTPDNLAVGACVPLASVQGLEDWHREDREPRLSTIYAIGAYFGVTRDSISDFIAEPVPVPRRGLAGMAMRLLIRHAAVTLLGVGHRFRVVNAEMVAAKAAPLALDAMALYGLYSGVPSAVTSHLEATTKRAMGAH
jgi:hypothetical protein